MANAGGNNHQLASNGGSIKKQIGTQYRGKQRNYTKEEGARERPNPPVSHKYNGNKNERRRGRYINFKYLDELLKLNEEDFVLRISENMRNLNDFMDKTDLSDDTYVLIIRILKKIFDSRFPDSQQILLQTILKEQFVKHLQKYLGSLPMHDDDQKRQNKFFWQDTGAFWTILIEVSRKALEMMPNYASNILPKVVLGLQICIPSFELHQNQRVSDEIKIKLNELIRALEATRLRFQEETVAKAKNVSTFENDEPPDDFRTISVYPDASEILSARNFLRPNVIDGPYKNVNHYLDVQFRLLREDFVSPLRYGVRSIQLGENKRHENVRVHKKIRFLYQEIVNEYHCVRIKFNFTSKSLSFSYENSKKFMFGTLLCFTHDNFATLKFGRVVKRDMEDLKKGELVVGFDAPEPDLSFDHDYMMIECSVYFEPYFHVLTALKKIHEDDFAMTEYIVNVQTDSVMPKYLDRHMIYEIDRKELYIEDLLTTTDNMYGFNDSQMDAFKAAVTREFAIIQGPPGTGKTFLGLKIAKTLLDNSEVWWESTPMLVICFTNHALDQFMEGLLSTTTNIVRIGGQSKNENLKDYNLRDLRRKASDGSFMSWNQVKDAHRDLNSVTAQIKEIEQYGGILLFSCFSSTVPGFDGTFFCNKNPHAFLMWLLEDNQQYLMRQPDRKDADLGTTEESENLNENDNDIENFSVDDHQNDNIIHESLAEEIIANMESPASVSAITLEGMTKTISKWKLELNSMENKTQEHSSEEINNTRKVVSDLEEQYKYLKKKLEEVRNAMQNQLIRTDVNTRHLALLSYDDRWALYTFWLNSYKQYLQKKSAALTQEFQGLYKQHEEIQNLENTRLLREKLVVGMTTTSAARLRSVLEGICSPIVIVEEAAEVLEAHIITALTKHCQHLILIGDHKQLKPSSADYTITKDYNLGISLFERMVNNGIQCHTLNIQHRMRPEISRLICPIIYPDLKDHETVFNRPPITGIDSCVYFIDHTNQEDDCGDNPTKKNLHEVKLALALARHLILNGYKSEQVTILAAYLGQMFAMLKERDSYGSIIKNVRIVALDNYQGEESDIIILSLVRSNTINKIGFLATENRVCVALSRAKYGFYMIGNMGLLSSVSKLWSGIKKTLESQNALGPALTLRCEIHTDITTLVRKSGDFARVPEGGCNRICNAKLVCDHLCRSVCHVQNREHKHYQCLERCTKKCDQNEKHICRKMCYEECGPCTYEVLRKLDCGHELLLACHIDLDTYKCIVLVRTKLPCGHDADKPCHISAENFVCPSPCDVTVEPCGHSCIKKCHFRDDPDHIEYKCMKKCARPRVGCMINSESTQHKCPNLCHQSCAPCDFPMKKQRTNCPHINTVDCNVDVDSVECTKPCVKLLSCGHKCKKECDEPCDPSSCNFKVKKILKLCGHEMTTPCNREPDRNRCDKQCPLKLLCGHNCTQRCNQVCTPQCKVLVDCHVEAACGHVIVSMKCHNSTSGLAKNDRELLANCTHLCNFKLKCGHQCSGTCGECSQGRFHERCAQKCGVPLVCNHECEYPCREACRPCNKPCTYRCFHSACKKKCGEICTPCQEPCKRRCEHQKCSRKCSSICDVPPCNEPCSKLLGCKHPCIGFCGDEPCPPKCLICDREELLETEMLFGYEDENSKFVFLVDCKHVIESEGMEQWLKMGDDSSGIGVKVCPKCKTPIKRTLRYSDQIKLAIADVNKVKVKAVGSVEEINDMRNGLEVRIKTLQERLKFSLWEPFLHKLEIRLKPVRNELRQNIDKIQLTAITSKLQVLEQIAGIYENHEELNFCPQYQQEIHDVLARDMDYITNQEIEDVMRELPRLLRAIQYECMKRSANFDYLPTKPEAKKLIENIQTTLSHLGVYEGDAQLKSWLEKLKGIVGSHQKLSDVERKQIVAAMGMQRGHWFKCPNGHVYAIGNCGGAVADSKCNVCGARIGGTGYRIASNNTLASEMDGATRAAYPGMGLNM